MVDLSKFNSVKAGNILKRYVQPNEEGISAAELAEQIYFEYEVMGPWDSVEEIKGEDENVIKFVFKNADAIAEAVLYKYPTYQERTVMCISTQSGCPMGCTFCGTGEFFNRDLSHAEIAYQAKYMAAMKDIDLKKVDNLQIMVMSMGEPLLNMTNVSNAFLSLAHASDSNAKLLVSTSAPKTKKGWEDMMWIAGFLPTVGLQFSIHESTDDARNLLIPMKSKLTLVEIAEKGVEFFEKTNRRPFFNYCVHEGNNSYEDAVRLAELFDPEIWEATLSVICEADKTMADAVSDQEDMVTEFSGTLVGLGFNTRVFNPAGQDDIGGGCGQLWQVQEWAKNNPDIMKQSPGSKCRDRS